MLAQSEHVRVPIGENWFKQSLAETIVWCTSLPIENDPCETPEIKHRRELVQRAGQLNHLAFTSNWPEFLKKIQYWRARRMFARSRLEEIAPLETQLRSLELKPELFSPAARREEFNEIVTGVVSRRARRLRSENRCPPPTDVLGDGRLLLFSPEQTLSDGAARYSSKGFFDDDNVPPWDTWVAFCDHYLISWVPLALIELANAGVDDNPEQCILWA